MSENTLIASILTQAKKDWQEGKPRQAADVLNFVKSEWFFTICTALDIDPVTTRNAIIGS